jgi:hypothetical protein
MEERVKVRETTVSEPVPEDVQMVETVRQGTAATPVEETTGVPPVPEPVAAEQTVREETTTAPAAEVGVPVEERSTQVVSTAPVQERTTRVVSTAPVEPLTREYRTKKTIFRVYQILWYILGLTEVLLAFRFFLRLFGANPGSGFAAFIYGITTPLAQPFAGILPSTGGGASVFEWSTLFAMVVWAVIFWGIISLLKLVRPVEPDEVDETVRSV